MTNSAQKRSASQALTSTQTSRARLTEIVAELKRREAEKAETLFDFVPRVSEGAVRPVHLAPLVDVFRRIDRGERVRACISVPPQHWKTTTTLHGFAWLLKRHPRWSLAYSTYQLAQSYSKSRECRDIARSAGVALHDEMQNLGEWRTPEGGGALFTSIDGPLTGKAARFIVIDDPYKDSVAARSEAVRERVRDWTKAVALTRLPEDGSLLIIHTRWYEHDLIGEVTRANNPLLDERYEYVNLPFLADEDGQPARHPYTSGTRVLMPKQQTSRGEEIGWTVDGAVRQLLSMREKADALAQGIPRKQVDGALWTEGHLTPWRRDAAPPLSRTIVAVDPNASEEATSAKADDAGIVTVARGTDGRAYVLADASGQMGVDGWAARAVAAFRRNNASAIVAEANQGGAMVERTIRAHLLTEALKHGRQPDHIPVKLVKVRGDKRGRAESARDLYGDPKTGTPSMVSHVGHHPRLEESMTTHDFATTSRSPGDLDALSLGLSDLMLSSSIEPPTEAPPPPMIRRNVRSAGW